MTTKLDLEAMKVRIETSLGLRAKDSLDLIAEVERLHAEVQALRQREDDREELAEKLECAHEEVERLRAELADAKRIIWSHHQEFSPGDIVQFKSGGPPMVVHHVSESRTFGLEVICNWFFSNNALVEGVFRAVQLRSATAEEKMLE